MEPEFTSQHDPLDQFIANNFYYINETETRSYYESLSSDILVASWKSDPVTTIDQHSFRENAYHFAKLIAERKPKLLLVDCRYLTLPISYLDQIWYLAQTKHLWLKLNIKKAAFIFSSNLSAQVAMEGLKEIADEEGYKTPKTRIFENISEACYWLNMEY